MAANYWTKVVDDKIDQTFRLDVPGGWLYLHRFWVDEDAKGGVMVFVPREPKKPKEMMT